VAAVKEHKTLKRKLSQRTDRAGSVTFYDIWPGNWLGLFSDAQVRWGEQL